MSKPADYKDLPWSSPEEYVDLARKHKKFGAELAKYLKERMIPEPKIKSK